ncbi:hypothetical protein RQP46_008181 [Phenoliferia psychrophenolica]
MYEQLEAGTIPRILLLSICAVASNFVSTAPAAIAQAEALVREVRYAIMDSLEVTEISILSATLLLILFEETKSRKASVWSLLGLAEKFVGGGILDVLNVGETTLKIQLPCEDSCFADHCQPSVGCSTLGDVIEAYFSGGTVGALSLSAHYIFLVLR